MKKLLPYILAYLIVATGTALYPRVYRHFATPQITTHPSGSVAVVVNPGLSHDEMTARLKQAGLVEATAAHPLPIPRPVPVWTWIYHYVFDAIVFSAFAGLVILFQRKFQARVSVNEPVA